MLTSYDAAYNRTEEATLNVEATAIGDKTYQYNSRNQLTSVDDNLRSVTTGGSTVGQFLYDYRGQRLISLNSLENGLQYYHFDALGSPVTLIKTDGSIQARYSSDACGHRRYQSGTSWNRFGFTGHEKDRETGLIYAKARYPDPGTGRF